MLVTVLLDYPVLIEKTRKFVTYTKVIPSYPSIFPPGADFLINYLVFYPYSLPSMLLLIVGLLLITAGTVEIVLPSGRDHYHGD